MPLVREIVTVSAVAVAGALLSGAGAAADAGSSVATWGSNVFGQLGDGSPSATVRGVPSGAFITDIVELSGGREHVVALKSNGTVVSWGSDAFGQPWQQAPA